MSQSGSMHVSILMNKHFSTAVSLFILVGLGAWLARSLGWYYGYWFTDVILHAIAGAAFGFLWLGLDRNGERRKAMVILGAAAFAVLGSVGWEVWELLGSRLFPERVEAYVPELADSLSDIGFGFLGGLLAGAWGRRK